jgi:uncharacterized protein with HEPN domain
LAFNRFSTSGASAMSNAERNALHAILDHMSSIEEILQGKGYKDYRTNRKTKIQVVGKFADIIDLADNMAIEHKKKLNKFPWEDFIALREKFICHDHGLDVEAIWNTSKRKIKVFRKMINEALYSSSVSDF